VCKRLRYTELRQPELLAICQCRLTVACHGKVTVTAAPLYFCGLVVVVLQGTGRVKLNTGSQMIEKMRETAEFMVEKRGGFSGIPEVIRRAELLSGGMQRLETLCHWAANALYSGRQVSLTSQQFTYRSNSDRNFCREEHLQFHCMPICTSDSPSY